MILLPVIQEKVNIAKLYYQVLLERYRANLIKGCDDKPTNLDRLKWLIIGLNANLRDAYNTSLTQSLYNQLVEILGAYNESFVVDPNVQIPNTTYQVITVDAQPPIYITSDDFIDNTYTNTGLVGNTSFAVFDQNSNRYLINGTEFIYNVTGGITIVGGIFGGESYVLIF